VKGLKLYEDVFTDSELCKLSDFVNEIHTAGQNGELSGKPLLNFVCVWIFSFLELYFMIILRFSLFWTKTK
jgi:hypothetical protein